MLLGCTILIHWVWIYMFKYLEIITGVIKEQLLDSGINQSNIHVDFMIGTEDLDTEANTEKGKALVFKNGNFNI